jgi:hypothetical protein
MPLNPCSEVVAIELLAKEWRKARQGFCWLQAGPDEVGQSLIELPVHVDTETVESKECIRVVCFTTAFGVSATRGLACRLQYGPAPGVWQEPPEEVFAAVFGDHIAPPPPEAGRIAGLASPRDRELNCEHVVEGGGIHVSVRREGETRRRFNDKTEIGRVPLRRGLQQSPSCPAACRDRI